MQASIPRLHATSIVSSTLSPFCIEEDSSSRLRTDIPRLCAATSKDNLVLVLGSKKRLSTFLSARIGSCLKVLEPGM